MPTLAVNEERRNVIEEIISTEQKHFDCLKVVRDLFMESLVSNDIIKLLPSEVNALKIELNNWNDLLKFSRSLLE